MRTPQRNDILLTLALGAAVLSAATTTRRNLYSDTAFILAVTAVGMQAAQEAGAIGHVIETELP